jgi:hypothetical protein
MQILLFDQLLTSLSEPELTPPFQECRERLIG